MMQFNSIIRASLVVVVVVATLVCSSDAAQYVIGAAIIGRCDSFAIEAGTSVSFNGGVSTVHTGNVGVSPGTSITGSPVLAAGYSKQSNTVAAQDCAADEATGYGILKNLNCTNLLPDSDLSGKTLYSGVYCTGSGFLTLNTATLYLDALGDPTAQFIFQTADTFISSVSTEITLLHGAQAKNVYWQIGSSATLGGTSDFKGQILAYASISVGTTATVLGRLYAQAGVSFAGADSITLP